MAENLYAGVSVQHFPGGEAELSTPHADVGAFLDYVRQFDPVNFHAKDDDVREWRFNQEFDNWQDRLGMDSVRVLHLYTHMGMATDGRYVAAMGRTWGNTFQASSDRMSFGDQRLRYLMLHGCDSLQMHFGQDPFRTWAAANHGARMIFGFDSLTYDVGGLGAGFFREWNTGKSFSQAWQDAALATLKNHRPSSTACGATAEEAQDRLWNERMFSGGAVSDNWYWWRWAGEAPIEVVIVITVPRVPMTLRLARRDAGERAAARLADRFGVPALLAAAGAPDEERHEPVDGLDRPRLVLHPDGSYQVFLAEPDRTAAALDPDTIAAVARRAVEGLDLGVEVALDGVTASWHGGGSRDGELVEASVGEYTVHFRQVVEGTPLVRGGAGQVTVTLDPGGTLCSVTDRTVAVVGVTESAPPDGSEPDVDGALARAEEELRRRVAGQGDGTAEVVVVPDTRDVGYRVDGDTAVTVARQDVEIRTGPYAFRRHLEVTL